MLTISKPLSAGQARAYHAKEFTNSQENYYATGAIVGQWHGRLAQSFGLVGDVNQAQFQRLAEGQHPQTGEQLIKIVQAKTYVNARGETVTQMPHRAGWDATFSAPKSVSLVALVGGDDRVREASSWMPGRTLRFQVADHPHLDYGYAVTSHSSQGLTADRVIVHVDGERSAEAIVNQRLAYVAMSRGRDDVQIYTDNTTRLGLNLTRDVSHRAAIEQPQQALTA